MNQATVSTCISFMHLYVIHLALSDKAFTNFSKNNSAFCTARTISRVKERTWAHVASWTTVPTSGNSGKGCLTLVLTFLFCLMLLLSNGVLSQSQTGGGRGHHVIIWHLQCPTLQICEDGEQKICLLWRRIPHSFVWMKPLNNSSWEP